MVDQRRVRLVKEGAEAGGPVVYWMSRDQRARDNWALLFGQELAIMMKRPLVVLFCLVPDFLNATIRQYGFMLKGLRKTEIALSEKNIPFYLLQGDPAEVIPSLLSELRAGVLVSDFDPLKIKRRWKSGVASLIGIPFYEVDAHNVVPCRIASSKQEFAARTLRPKLRRLLPEFLTAMPRLRRHPHTWAGDMSPADWDDLELRLKVDRSVEEVRWITPGEKSARSMLRRFISRKLPFYNDRRNDPTEKGQSDFSPYLHFGQISAQRVAIEVRKSGAPKEAVDAFIEELIVRRELSDNFCLFTEGYDTFEGFPAWAKKSLNAHRRDRRPYLYDREDFEKARTHDPLWNAAQMEMVRRGKMHGYMRMYWAKKILEWSESPERAMETAIFLNDRYELDGRDPNGYTGIAWSIGGVHDRAWPERKIYGKVRYMSYEGCRSKFDVEGYINLVGRL